MEKQSSQLTSDNRPFVRNLLHLSLEMKAFFNKVLAAERDTFQDNIVWPQYRLFLFYALYGIVAQLKRHTISDIFTETLRGD